jgi:pimeloyl-ACP methyl ester carboxylesterase
MTTNQSTSTVPEPTAARERRFVRAGARTALAAAALLLCVLITSSTESSARDDVHPSGTISPWTACPDAASAQCATLKVPLDWAKPRGAQISLSAIRRPADNPDQRIGTLFFNPGGPGDSPRDYITGADVIFSDTLRHRFDIVGLDPRATGVDRLHCDIPALTATGTLFPRTAEQFNELRNHNRDVGSSCLGRYGEFLAHTDTISVARDHEALRKALGVKQVSWLGLSYGTQLAANYAELFPRRTRAMVLDAALEHSMPEIEQVADESMAAEDSFNRFAAWCPSDPTCALQGQDVPKVFDRLVADADEHPLAVPGAIHPVTGEDIRMGTKGLLRFKAPSIYGPDLSWAGLSRALKAAVDGDGSPFALPADQPQDGIFSLLAIACMEYAPQIHTYDQMRQRIEMGRQLAPHLQGASETWQVNYCIDWPVPASNPPRTLDVRGVDTLIVHATHDPSVPYKWAHTLASQIEGSAILTRIGDGHTSYHTSQCARATIDAYLVERTAPANSTCTD